ncbi:uncharacterized protein N7525_000642, partial [Penicillium rubens]|uniref:uncharacterized protein n=1 Tax=Penicillium rubens TaxID=1108849 RepID=UPI0023A54333
MLSRSRLADQAINGGDHRATIWLRSPSLGAAITEEPKKSLLSITWSQKSFIYGFKDHYMAFVVLSLEF